MFLYNAKITKSKMFGEIAASVSMQGRRHTGFVWQMKGDRGWFANYPTQMPAHLIHNYCNQHRAIILSYNYNCIRRREGVELNLETVRLYYPAGALVPYRVIELAEGWKLVDFDNATRKVIPENNYDVLNGEHPIFPEELMIPTFPAPYEAIKKMGKRAEKKGERKTHMDEEKPWKGLASMYICM